MEKKMTNKQALAFILDSYELPTEVKEKVQGMIAQLEKKSTAPRKPTAAQMVNEQFKELIMEIVNDKGKTATDIQKAIPALAGESNQKVASLLRALREEGKVTKDTIKGRSYFFKVEE